MTTQVKESELWVFYYDIFTRRNCRATLEVGAITNEAQGLSIGVESGSKKLHGGIWK